MNRSRRIAAAFALSLSGIIGWESGGTMGALAGAVLAAAAFAFPWRGRELWSWVWLYLCRNRPVRLSRPVAVANDRSVGGIRYQDDVAVAAIQILGKVRQPTLLQGSFATHTTNSLDIVGLLPMLHQSLGLTMESLSVVSIGSRRGGIGDFPRVYETLIGTSPYAGRRETWLILRFNGRSNGDALRLRLSIGTAALAAAQRVAARLRTEGVRARVGSTTDVLEFEKRVGSAALEPNNRRWQSVRGDTGWLTTYAYRSRDIDAEKLGQAWCLPADGIVQNVTLYEDHTLSATVTVLTPQPPKASPSVLIRTLPGEQAQAVAASLCGPRPEIRGVCRAPVPACLVIPVGPSGVLFGKMIDGNRLLLPVCDPAENTHVEIAADDRIAKRLIIRAVGAGERVTVHTTDARRWDRMRMPNLAITDQPRPAPGSTMSVVDGTVLPAPRPQTLISLDCDSALSAAPADILIEQTGPASVRVHTGVDVKDVEIDLFRVENRYLTAELELVD